MTTTIKYFRKSVYGNELVYPADPRQAESLNLLTGQKTLTQSSLNALAGLGFTLEETFPPRKDGLK